MMKLKYLITVVAWVILTCGALVGWETRDDTNQGEAQQPVKTPGSKLKEEKVLLTPRPQPRTNTYENSNYPITEQVRPTTKACTLHRETFTKEYTKALSGVNFSAPPKYDLPGRFHEGDAFCGKYLLWNLTGGNDLWHATGSGLQNTTTLTPCTVSLHNCAESPNHCSDVHFVARLTGPTIVPAEVVKRQNECAFDITFMAYEPGDYELHIKMAHLNGSSEDARKAISLGVDRGRVRIDGRKLYVRHKTCASHRHIDGSPFKVAISGEPLHPLNKTGTPLCRNGNYTRGRWVTFNNQMCQTPQPYCSGHPWWLSDSYGYNVDHLWAPTQCHYHLYAPPNGPQKFCFDRQGVIGFVGDSIAREYVQNCRIFYTHTEAGFRCEHWHMIIKGEAYSKEYAKSVVKVVVDKIHNDKPVALAVNFGMMHMIGMCNDTAWDYFMRYFAEELTKRPPVAPMRKIWLGAPQVHYATRGMTATRAARWDAIALSHLAPLGFESFNSTPITAPKEEGAWDGLHNAAEKGHKQAKVRNRRVKEWKWNGGVSHMLWNALLNMLCPIEG
eukprot:TRINITY_DN21358_c0_g1_i1.p1 TRINITY_DN21358_c0_g1~~TRINITY_DN21358_c0_g1_i1.p1  ORF type:complete len:569 (+),score=54.04 TRINITY_DN21358_c0_g1_i1:40-1707(+)